jgi:hypothetical protein
MPEPEAQVPFPSIPSIAASCGLDGFLISMHSSRIVLLLIAGSGVSMSSILSIVTLVILERSWQCCLWALVTCFRTFTEAYRLNLDTSHSGILHLDATASPLRTLFKR